MNIEQLILQVPSLNDLKKPEAGAKKILAMMKNRISGVGEGSATVDSLSSEARPWDSGDGEYRFASLLAIHTSRQTEFQEALKNDDCLSALKCQMSFRLDTESPIKWGDDITFKINTYDHEASGETRYGVRAPKLVQATASAMSFDFFGDVEEVEDNSALETKKAKA
tara:strand:+ start:838 stop:1338 length:501 start_codon:yes stop_codon:yes gene_type:complete